MPLPELPKKMNRREADIQRRVAERVVKKHPHPNWLLEIKTKDGKQDHDQRVAQKQVENGTFLHKFKDMGNAQPGDYVHLGDADYILCTEVKHNELVCVVNDGVDQYRIRI